MTAYKCTKCGKDWYSAATQIDKPCEDCGGELEKK
jgi:DNA-directed RNA polymerase subunit RPC12/RpoP